MNPNLMIVPHRKAVMKKMEVQNRSAPPSIWLLMQSHNAGTLQLALNTAKSIKNSCKCNSCSNKQVISYLVKTESDSGSKMVSLRAFLLLIRTFIHYSSKTMPCKINRCKAYLISQRLTTMWIFSHLTSKTRPILILKSVPITDIAISLKWCALVALEGMITRPLQMRIKMNLQSLRGPIRNNRFIGPAWGKRKIGSIKKNNSKEMLWNQAASLPMPSMMDGTIVISKTWVLELSSLLNSWVMKANTWCGSLASCLGTLKFTLKLLIPDIWIQVSYNRWAWVTSIWIRWHTIVCLSSKLITRPLWPPLSKTSTRWTRW